MVGRGKPDMHSAELSLFVLDAGIKLSERSDPATSIEGGKTRFVNRSRWRSKPIGRKCLGIATVGSG
jgi:hypothetical protein